MLNFDQAGNGGGEVEAMINSKHFALNDIENTQCTVDIVNGQ